MIQLVFRSFKELLDPKLKRMFWQCFVLTITAIFSCCFFGWWLAGIVGDFKFSFLAYLFSWVSSLAILVVGIVFFPSINLAVASIFGDRICTHVESKYYKVPNDKGKIHVIEVTKTTSRFFAVTLILNLILLPIYVLGMVVPGLSFLFFYTVNGYLIGREFFEMVTVRHLTSRHLNSIRRKNRGMVTLGGTIIAVFMSIPILNLFAPIFGLILMTHVYHNIELSEYDLEE